MAGVQREGRGELNASAKRDRWDHHVVHRSSHLYFVFKIVLCIKGGLKEDNGFENGEKNISVQYGQVNNHLFNILVNAFFMLSRGGCHCSYGNQKEDGNQSCFHYLKVQEIRRVINRLKTLGINMIGSI